MLHKEWPCMVNFILFIIVIMCCHIINCANQNRRDYMSPIQGQVGINEIHLPVSKKLSRKIGSNVTLHCNFNACNHIIQDVYWKFSDNRIPINKSCYTNLRLVNITVIHSGLYTCIVDDLPKYQYQLEVYDDDPQLTTIDLNPRNVSINLHSSTILQCRASSEVLPIILWFKQSNKRIHTSDILYENKFYTKIRTSNIHDKITLSEYDSFSYFSKLSIQDAVSEDGGVYACVVLTTNGKEVHIRRSLVHVNMMSSISLVDNSIKITQTQSKSLPLLFLIPVPFVMIPCAVWICYYRQQNIRRIRLRRMQNLQHRRHNRRNYDRIGNEQLQPLEALEPESDGCPRCQTTIGNLITTVI